MKFVLTIFLSVLSYLLWGQSISLVSNEDIVASYILQAKSLTINIEDISPTLKSFETYARKVPLAIDIDDINYCEVDFDKNSNSIMDEGDLGFRIKGYKNEGYTTDNGWFVSPGINNCNYFLYPKFDESFYVHMLNRGCDNKFSKALFYSLNDTSFFSTNKHPIWRISIPISELITTTSKQINFRIRVFRKSSGQFLEFPNYVQTEFKTLNIPIKENNLAKEKEATKLKESQIQIEKSKGAYLTKISYNGVFIDMGNGKFAELKLPTTDNAVVVSTFNNKPSRYYSSTPAALDITDAVLIPKCSKIIFYGDEFTGDFQKYISIHEIENLESQKVTTYNGFGETVKMKALLYAGKFGNDYSLKSLQPENLYTPKVDRTDLSKWEYIEFNTKTISPTRYEIFVSPALEKGKTYCIWSMSKLYLFKIQ